MADKPISALPAIPGNLDLNALLAVVQGGITYRTEAQKLVDLTLGSIKVVENANGVSLRIPGVRVQLCWFTTGLLTADEAVGSVFRSPSTEWTFPQAFLGAPQVVATPQFAPGGGGDAIGSRLGTPSSSSVTVRLTGANSHARNAMSLIAVGRY